MSNEDSKYIKKVVINTKKGGSFELSKQALAWLKNAAPSIDTSRWENHRDYRTHPLLIECVLSLGSKASTEHSNIECVDIKKGVRFLIQKNDGAESVLFPYSLKWSRIWAW